MRKPFAGAAHAALHFVDHQQPVLLIAKLSQGAQVVNVHRIDAAFALDGFQENRHHIRVAGGSFLQCLHIIERHADETFHQRAKTGLHFGVACGAQGGDAAAVKGLVVNHDFRALDTLVMTEFARQFESGFIGLQTGRAKKDIAHARQLDQLGRQRFLQGDMVVIGGVNQPADLLLQSRHQLGVVMPQRVDGNTAQRVQVGLAVDVPHAAALSMRERQRQSAVGVHDVRGSGFNGDG